MVGAQRTSLWWGRSALLTLVVLVSANLAWTADLDRRVADAARKNDTAAVRTYIKDHANRP